MCILIISLLLLLYVSVILGFICYLVGVFWVWECSKYFPYKNGTASLLYAIFKKDSIYLFLERGERKEEERE